MEEGGELAACHVVVGSEPIGADPGRDASFSEPSDGVVRPGDVDIDEGEGLGRCRFTGEAVQEGGDFGASRRSVRLVAAVTGAVGETFVEEPGDRLDIVLGRPSMRGRHP